MYWSVRCCHKYPKCRRTSSAYLERMWLLECVTCSPSLTRTPLACCLTITGRRRSVKCNQLFCRSLLVLSPPPPPHPRVVLLGLKCSWEVRSQMDIVLALMASSVCARCSAAHAHVAMQSGLTWGQKNHCLFKTSSVAHTNERTPPLPHAEQQTCRHFNPRCRRASPHLVQRVRFR
jgi:hypothetical protein